MKTLKDLREERASKIDAQGKMLKTEAGETRTADFSEEEQTRFNQLDADIEALDAQIEAAEKREKAEARIAAEKTKNKPARESEEERAAKNFDFGKALRSAAAGQNQEGLEKEVYEEAVNEARSIGQSVSGNVAIPNSVAAQMIKRNNQAMGLEKRDLNVGTNADGGFGVPTDIDTNMLTALRPRMVLAGLGAQTLGNLTGNYDQIAATKVTTAWEGETDDAAESSPTISKRGISPKRLATFLTFSKQLVLSSAPAIQQQLQNDMFNAVAEAVEAAAINGGGTGEPTGILATSGILAAYAGNPAASSTNADGAALKYEDINNLEGLIDAADANRGSMGYLTNSKVKKSLKNTKIDAGSGLFVWPQGAMELNGYNVAVSNLVPSDLTKGSGTGLSALIFGNFNDLVIAQWAGIDLTVDNITKAKKAQIEIVLNSWFDTMLRRTASFAAIKDAVA